MKNFKLTCLDGYTKTFAAMTLDEAVEAATLDEEVKVHVATNHPEMAGKTPEEMRQAVMGMMKEETAGMDVPTGEMPVGGAM